MAQSRLCRWVNWVASHGARGWEVRCPLWFMGEAFTCVSSGKLQVPSEKGDHELLLSSLYLENPKKHHHKSESSCFWHNEERSQTRMVYEASIQGWNHIFLSLPVCVLSSFLTKLNLINLIWANQELCTAGELKGDIRRSEDLSLIHVPCLRIHDGSSMKWSLEPGQNSWVHPHNNKMVWGKHACPDVSVISYVLIWQFIRIFTTIMSVLKQTSDFRFLSWNQYVAGMIWFIWLEFCSFIRNTLGLLGFLKKNVMNLCGR